MKLLLVASFVLSSAFAFSGEVLLTCTNTGFQDLNKIVITQGENSSILVTEINSKNKSTTTERIANKEGIELSDWYGYSRRLISDNSGWTIVYQDECTGGAISVNCK